MLDKIRAWIGSVISKMLYIGDARQMLHTDVAISAEMQEAIDLWAQMFTDRAGWISNNTQSLGLAASIAGEIARLVTVEMSSEITGSARADFLQEQYNAVLRRLRVQVEIAAAGGGLVFKPYVDDGRIVVDYVPAWRFLPTAFNSSGEVTGGIFAEHVTRGRTYYTRLEYHRRTDEGYTISNYAYRSGSDAALGTVCPLGEVDEWSDLEPEITIKYADGTAPEKMLFSYFRLPFANNIDMDSPLGVSIFARAAWLIKDADEQYSRILWEYEGSELAIDASQGAVKTNVPGGVQLPRRKQRLFRQLDIDPGAGADLYKVFSPAIRDSSLFTGLDKILKRIEFNCYLSYGTLSDPQSVEKTAEEIRSSKQRSYSAVRDIQETLEKALDDLIWAMDLYASLYKLAPTGKYKTAYTWGDGVLEDVNAEFARRKQLVDGGYLKPAKLLAWYFGVSEEDAADYVPDAPNLDYGA